MALFDSRALSKPKSRVQRNMHHIHNTAVQGSGHSVCVCVLLSAVHASTRTWGRSRCERAKNEKKKRNACSSACSLCVFCATSQHGSATSASYPLLSCRAVEAEVTQARAEATRGVCGVARQKRKLRLVMLQALNSKAHRHSVTCLVHIVLTHHWKGDRDRVNSW